MSRTRDVTPPTRPRAVPQNDSPQGRRSPSASPSDPRRASTVRLGSPLPSSHGAGTPAVRQIPVPSELSSGTLTPLAGAGTGQSAPGPGRSALATALEGTYGRSPPRFGTPPIRTVSPLVAGAALAERDQDRYDSFETRSVSVPPNANQNEDPEVVRRHLVQPSDVSVSEEPTRQGRQPFSRQAGPSLSVRERSSNGGGSVLDEFSSLQLQGGDVTRQVYRWADAEARSLRAQRSKSFHINRPGPHNEVMDIQNIKAPGGFRRNYIRRSAPSPSPARYGTTGAGYDEENTRHQAKLFTNNFIEFLTLYGHFAGEELEDDDDLESEDYFASEIQGDEDVSDGDEDEREGRALLTPKTPRTPGGRRKKSRSSQGQNSSMGAAMLLLKSFVGTGVLFLPKAFLNGGMLFSNLVLLFVAALSYYCFILLVNTRLKVDGSYGDIGGVLWGKLMRFLILSSIVISQIGFVAAYIVFTSQNLQAFILAVSKCRTWIDIKFMVLMQLIIFLPLSLVRDISKLGFTALVADAFILLGLVYLYYYDVATIAGNGGVADIVQFNPSDWTLFIGTAIFTFEGIGLIIPIQESMRKPANFPRVLAVVMVVITTIFVSMGALSYAAYGSKTKTVVLLNMPQDSKFVNAVQFLYSLAILLSTPLQLFPVIRILENGIFVRSGKNNPYIKWKKNVFRFVLVILCAVIAWGGAGDLDKFVALVGSFACVPLVYIYPPLLHYRAVARSRWRRAADVAVCIFGVVVMVYTTALTIISWTGPSSPPPPGYCDEQGAA